MSVNTPKNIDLWHLMYPFTQGFLGSYMGLMVPTLISSKSYLHIRFLQWVKNAYISWTVAFLVLCTIIFVQVISIKLMVTSLKKVGASIMVVTMYLSNFFFTNLIDYFTKGIIPSKYQ